MRPRLLGLTGFAQSGKDSVAGFLKDYGYQRVAFADGVREALLALDPLIPEYIPRSAMNFNRLSTLVRLHGWDEVKTNQDFGASEVRRLLQKLGTEVVRDMVDQDAWVHIAAQKVLTLL